MLDRKITVVDGRYLLTLEPMPEGGYFVSSPSDPALLTQGSTIEECIENARDAAEALLASRIKLARETVRKPRPKARRAA